MLASPEKCAQAARLMRKAGHGTQSARYLELATTYFPGHPELEKEAKKLQSSLSPTPSRFRSTLTYLVDFLGLPVLLLWLLTAVPILFAMFLIPSG